MIGKIYRTKIQDMEDDEEYGEVTHPIGSTFTVERQTHTEECHPDPPHGEKGHTCGPMYAISWHEALNTEGKSVPAKGMWTIWSADEIARDAEEI